MYKQPLLLEKSILFLSYDIIFWDQKERTFFIMKIQTPIES